MAIILTWDVEVAVITGEEVAYRDCMVVGSLAVPYVPVIKQWLILSSTRSGNRL
jgi:hypothetical protein